MSRATSGGGAALSASSRSAGVRRLLQESAELENESCAEFTAAPLDDDLFHWHYTIRGPSGAEYEGGVYHGRIVLPSDYPFKPPEIYLSTPSGRFEVSFGVFWTLFLSFLPFVFSFLHSCCGVRGSVERGNKVQPESKAAVVHLVSTWISGS